MSVQEEKENIDEWEYHPVERSKEEKRELYTVESEGSRGVTSHIVPFVEFENGSFRFTKRLR